MLFYLPILLAVISNISYHIFLRSTPTNVHPMISLAVTYCVAFFVTILMIPLFPLKSTYISALKEVNWVSYVLGLSLVGLELGFLLAYRYGWKISLGSITTNVTVTLFLIPIGLFFYKEFLSSQNIVGIFLCIAGIILVTWR